jgi:hypothetical protein
MKYLDNIFKVFVKLIARNVNETEECKQLKKSSSIVAHIV